jgi:hypothetical protein
MQYEATSTQQAPLYLSSLPTQAQINQLARANLGQRIVAANDLHKSEKRKMFSKLFYSTVPVRPEMLDPSQGVTVGELSVATMCCSSRRFQH